jgi:hypothetical protein
MNTANNSKITAVSTRIIITRSNQVGVLTKAADGRWDIMVNGAHGPANYYYDDDQVERIVARAQADGATVEVVK